MIKVLVACADYPRGENKALQYVHVRNKEYINNGIEVDVLNFSQNENYTHEGIHVYCLDYVRKNIRKYQGYILICHAPNLRNHYVFIKKYRRYFIDIIFFFHGHEIVEQIKVYPKPYSFNKSTRLKKVITFLYDKFKILIWSKYFRITDTKSKLIFVSNFLCNEFINNTGIQYKKLRNRIYVINNSVGRIFQEEKYDELTSKYYNYITIRSDIDSAVYCVDLVSQIAEKNPDKKFLLIGRGKYFEYSKIPSNMVHINGVLDQEQMIEYINNSKVALMPTRRDSQGVMACELATFGIPLITSNIPVCKEMFSSFKNVVMLDESTMLDDINAYSCSCLVERNKKFFTENTIANEIGILNKIMI